MLDNSQHKDYISRLMQKLIYIMIKKLFFFENIFILNINLKNSKLPFCFNIIIILYLLIKIYFVF